MKSKHLFFAAIFPFSFQSQADELPTWFVGTQYSFNRISSAPDREPEAIGVMGGYQMSEYFSLEARYSFGTPGYSHPFIVNGDQEDYKEEVDTQAFLLLKASYPVFESINLYLLAGIGESEYEITTSSSFTDLNGSTTVTYPTKIDVSETGLTYGLGADYRLSPNFLVFIDHKILPDLRVGSGRSEDWNATSVGIKYAF